MAISATWYFTEVWNVDSTTWTRDDPGTGANTLTTSTPVNVWFGTSTEWNALSPAQQQSYGLHIIDVSGDGLVDGDELRTAVNSSSDPYFDNFTLPNNAGYLGTADVDPDGAGPVGLEPSVGLALDGALNNSDHALIVTLNEITTDPVTTHHPTTGVPQTYQGGNGHFKPFGAGTLAPCLVRGTMVLTPDGEKPVEALAKGDLVMTADRDAQPIALIMSVKVSAGRLAQQPQLRPIRIRAGALGPDSPTQDLLVSPQHRVLVRSKIAQRMFGAPEILVAAKQLLAIDGIEIDDTAQEVEYFHVLFDHHEVIRTNGAETESLYTGPEGLKMLGQAALDEIYALFPELAEEGTLPDPARILVPGREGRHLALRHAANRQQLVM